MIKRLLAYALSLALAVAPTLAIAQSINSTGVTATTNAQSGWPYFLPSLFGSGASGACTLTTNADVGYLGSYGVSQCTSASLAAGQTLTVAQGSSSGAFILGGTGTCTIAGSIVANGGAGSNGVVDGGGAGGGTAGGGAGGAKTTVNGLGNSGSSATKTGHGATVSDGTTTLSNRAGVGASAGSYETANAATVAGRASNFPTSDTSATVVRAILSPSNRLVLPSKLTRTRYLNWTVAAGTASASGTALAVNPTTNDIGPWAQLAGTGWLDFDFIPSGPPGFSGATTGVVVTNTAGGGGGGGGGVIIIECNTIVLTAGYSITATGGAGGNAFVDGLGVASGGSGGSGGIVILIYHTLTGSTAAITAAGGAAGTGAGTAAVNGIAGLAGGVYFIQV